MLQAQIARRRRPVPRRAPLGRLRRRPGHRQQPHRRAAAALSHAPISAPGLKRLSALGLSFDAWLYHPQLADVIDLARAFPATPIVMGHVGGLLGYGPYAGKQGRDSPRGRRHGRARHCPNVVVKLGGMVNRGAALRLSTLAGAAVIGSIAEVWRPYVETCIELFGADRCMFESNFPVDKMAVGYAALWNAFKRIAAGASPDEKLALFGGTATRVYRLAID